MPGSIQSIERAAAVLELIAAGPRPLRLAEISLALHLPKGTAHGILRTLCQVGYVRQDRASGRYELGPGLTRLGSGTVDVNEMRALSMNWADPLAARTGHAVRVGMLSVRQVLVVHYVFRPDDTHQVADTGALLPAHATALGKVLLAHHPGAVAGAVEPGADATTAYTTRTIVDPARLADELDHARRRGHAVEHEEHVSDRSAVAAPIVGAGGLVVAAVGIHGATDRICDGGGTPHPKLVKQVVDCARAISHELQLSRTAG